MIRLRLLPLALLFLVACRAPATVVPTSAIPATPAVATPTLAPAVTATLGPPIYTDPAQPLAARVDDLLARMTLPEKIGQMTQVEKDRIVPADISA